MNTEEFEAFRHRAVHALRDLNDNCTQQFRHTDWPSWDYDLDAGTIVFSENGAPKVVASIQVVGTTSSASTTWLWGWANENLPDGVTDRVCEVRTFGEREGLPQFTEATLPDDEYLGWEMTAIAAQIIGARGGYRCPVEGGFIYLVYTSLNFVDSTGPVHSPSPPTDRTIKCDTHGSGRMTFACEHLIADPKQEWFSDLATSSNRWPEAWCARCDQVYQEQGEWNANNEGRVSIKLLCHRCYESLRAQDSTLPSRP